MVIQVCLLLRGGKVLCDNTILWPHDLPSCSASSLPLSTDTTLSSSMSHLFPARTTWALSHEYVFIWVDLQRNNIKGCQRWMFCWSKTFQPLFCCHFFWQKRSMRDGRVEEEDGSWTLSSQWPQHHVIYESLLAGKVGRLLLLTQIHTRSTRQNAVILHLFCNFPFLSALNYG